MHVGSPSLFTPVVLFLSFLTLSDQHFWKETVPSIGIKEHQLITTYFMCSVSLKLDHSFISILYWLLFPSSALILSHAHTHTHTHMCTHFPAPNPQSALQSELLLCIFSLLALLLTVGFPQIQNLHYLE